MSGDRTAHLVAEVAEEKVERRSFFRSLLLFLSSNIGLVILVILYSIGGAFLFILLEQYIELQNCQQAYRKSTRICPFRFPFENVASLFRSD